MSRYVSLWFPHLQAEYAARQRPEIREQAFVLSSKQRGRMVVDSVNPRALHLGIRPGMVLADCKAIHPELLALDTEPGRSDKLLQALAEWCIGYTPFAAIDGSDGLLLDASGCTHLWGGEKKYLESIRDRLNQYGYTLHIALADTLGTAWGMARFGPGISITKPGHQKEALKNLPAAALRLEPEIVNRLRKLGLPQIGHFIDLPRTVLRRRFGPSLSLRIAQALGQEPETAMPIKPIAPYQERLFCAEPIATATGIRMALERLLETLCARLEKEAVGLRHAVFTAYRMDGNIQHIEIGTGYASRHMGHLYKLFEHKIPTLQPDLGFESFVLEAPQTEALTPEQAAMWNTASQNDQKLRELLDRLGARTGTAAIKRYLPAQHHWPERAVKEACPIWEKTANPWRAHCARPVQLLPRPEAITVMAQMPDYPPRQFRYLNQIHEISRADGPERIEQEWWLANGLYRDYYAVEDTSGARYWLFRSGPYSHKDVKWFLHGFFA